MDEIEVPLEQSQEQILESAHHAQKEHVSWINKVALSSALLAVAAAVSALLAGHHSNEALLEQIKSSDHWAYYQAKGIKAAVLDSKVQLLSELGKKVDPKDEEKLKAYKEQQDEIAKQADEKEKESRAHLATHQIFARSVTFFQIAIAVSAISVLIRRRRFWLLSLAFGAVGVCFLIQGFIAH